MTQNLGCSDNNIYVGAKTGFTLHVTTSEDPADYDFLAIVARPKDDASPVSVADASIIKTTTADGFDLDFSLDGSITDEFEVPGRYYTYWYCRPTGGEDTDWNLIGVGFSDTASTSGVIVA